MADPSLSYGSLLGYIANELKQREPERVKIALTPDTLHVDVDGRSYVIRCEPHDRYGGALTVLLHDEYADSEPTPLAPAMWPAAGRAVSQYSGIPALRTAVTDADGLPSES